MDGKRKAREARYAGIGEQGRRTGIALPKDIPVNRHGFQDVDAFFQSPPAAGLDRSAKASKIYSKKRISPVAAVTHKVRATTTPAASFRRSPAVNENDPIRGSSVHPMSPRHTDLLRDLERRKPRKDMYHELGERGRKTGITPRIVPRNSDGTENVMAFYDYDEQPAPSPYRKPPVSPYRAPAAASSSYKRSNRAVSSPNRPPPLSSPQSSNRLLSSSPSRRVSDARSVELGRRHSVYQDHDMAGDYDYSDSGDMDMDISMGMSPSRRSTLGKARLSAISHANDISPSRRSTLGKEGRISVASSLHHDEEVNEEESEEEQEKEEVDNSLRSRISAAVRGEFSNEEQETDQEQEDEEEDDINESFDRRSSFRRGRVSSIREQPEAVEENDMDESFDRRSSIRRGRVSTIVEHPETENEEDEYEYEVEANGHVSDMDPAEYNDDVDLSGEMELEQRSPQSAPQKSKKKEHSRSVSRRRYSTPPEGIRRSKRKKFSPLAFWRNERIVFKRRTSGQVPHLGIHQVIRNPESPTKPLQRASSRQPRGRSISRNDSRQPPPPPVVDYSHLDERTSEDATILDYDPQKEENERNEIIRRIAFPSRLIDPISSSRHAYRYQKIFTEGHYMAGGILELPVDYTKSAKNTKDNSFMFYVARGAIRAIVHKTQFSVAEGGFFLVPRGNKYSIENITKVDAKLVFMQAREVPEEIYYDQEDIESEGVGQEEDEEEVT